MCLCLPFLSGSETDVSEAPPNAPRGMPAGQAPGWEHSGGTTCLTLLVNPWTIEQHMFCSTTMSEFRCSESTSEFKLSKRFLTNRAQANLDSRVYGFAGCAHRIVRVGGRKNIRIDKLVCSQRSLTMGSNKTMTAWCSCDLGRRKLVGLLVSELGCM